MEPISYPTYGDRSAAFALGVSFQYDGLTWSTGSDVVIFQVRRVIGLVLYGELGIPHPSQSGAFVAEAVDRLEGRTGAALAPGVRGEAVVPDAVAARERSGPVAVPDEAVSRWGTRARIRQ